MYTSTMIVIIMNVLGSNLSGINWKITDCYLYHYHYKEVIQASTRFWV